MYAEKYSRRIQVEWVEWEMKREREREREKERERGNFSKPWF
jgi:hypothetical protein